MGVNCVLLLELFFSCFLCSLLVEMQIYAYILIAFVYGRPISILLLTSNTLHGAWLSFILFIKCVGKSCIHGFMEALSFT